MLNEHIRENTEEELRNIRLKDVIGEEISFSDEQLQNLEKFKNAICRENIYKHSKFQIFSQRILEQFSGNTQLNVQKKEQWKFHYLIKRELKDGRKNIQT